MRAGKGSRAHCASFTLQAGRRRPDAGGADPVETGARVGFTVTKKVGNAVVRNRIRRRLREAVRLSEALPTDPQTDYVLVARREALSVPFVRLMSDLEATLRRSGGRSGKGRGAGGDGRRGVT